MAEQSPSIQFEDVPLEEARRMGRGPRMDPELYHAFKEKIQSGVPGAIAGKCTVRGDDRLAYCTFCCENSS